MAAKKKKPESKVVELSLLHDRAYRVFEPLYKEMEENGRYRRAKHYSKADEKKINADGRRAFSLGLVEAKGNTLLSQFIMSPYEFRVRARNKESEFKAEIENSIFRYEYDVNDLQYEFADWYQKGLFYKYGVIAREIDYTENPEGEIVVKNLLPDQCLWDTNCKEFNVSRYANFFQDWDFPTRDELITEYDLNEDEVMEFPKARQLMETSRIKYENWMRQDEGTETVKRVRHFQREFRTEYLVTYNNGDSKPMKLKCAIDKKDAAKSSVIQAAEAEQGNIYPILCEPVTTEWIIRTDFCPLVDKELFSEEKRTKLIPRHVYSGLMEDGNMTTITDLVKDTARNIDRLATQIDIGISKMIKNSYELDWENLVEEDRNNWRKLSKQLVTGGAVLRKRKGVTGRIVQSIDEGHGPPPVLFQTFTYWVTALEDMMGGRNAQGLKERNASNESGVLFEKRLEAGFAMAYIFLYNFGRAMKNLGEGMHEDIQEVYGSSEERILDITDSDLDEAVKQLFTDKGIYEKSETRMGEGYLKLTKEHLDFGKAKVRIIIDKGNYTPSAKEKKFNMWTAINKMRIEAGQAPYPFSYYADTADIDATVLDKMKKFDEKIEQQQENNLKMEKMKMVFDAQNTGMGNLQKSYGELHNAEAAGKEAAVPTA